jgi:hypothetical protein
MSTITIIFRTAALLATVAVAGCAGDRFADWQWPGSNKEKEQPKPIINMAGRWMLTSPNRGQCGMNFTGAPKATEGKVAPEGGCPGSFYTSRSWTMNEEGQIIIRDHNGEQLVQLAPAGTGSAMWLEGQASTGERVMLAR